MRITNARRNLPKALETMREAYARNDLSHLVAAVSLVTEYATTIMLRTRDTPEWVEAREVLAALQTGHVFFAGDMVEEVR